MPPAEAAASRLPDLRDVSGPRSRAAPHTRSVGSMAMIRIAVDALGGDRGPEAIVAGAVEAAPTGSSRSSSGRPASTPTGSSSSRRRRRSAMDEKPAEAVRSKPDSSLVAPCRPSREGRGRRGRLGREHGRDARRRPAPASPPPGGAAARRSRCRSRAATGPSVLARLPARTPTRAPEHLLQFAHMGAVFAEEILGIARPERPPALDRRGGGEGKSAHARGARAAGGERRSASTGNTESRDLLKAQPTSSSPTGSPATSRSS